MGILDLPGFENLMTNSLEQLHFNLAEERLQDHVTELVFRREFHDLQTDGIKVPDTKFRDNSEVLDAFYDVSSVRNKYILNTFTYVRCDRKSS